MPSQSLCVVQPGKQLLKVLPLRFDQSQSPSTPTNLFRAKTVPGGRSAEAHSAWATVERSPRGFDDAAASTLYAARDAGCP